MKYKNYGNNDREYDSGLGLELLEITDNISARNTNRPIANLSENQEEIYKLLNNLLKTIYGNEKQVILPSIYEEFDPEGFIINSFFNNSENYYLRVPTGSMLLSSNNNKKEFSKFGEKLYNDNFSDNSLTKDPFKSFTFTNRPNINLLERQLANLISLDLSDLNNDIKVNEVEIPITYPVYKLNDQSLPITDAFGNFQYVTDTDGNILYVFDKDQNPTDNPDYYTNEIKVLEREVSYGIGDTSFSPQGKDSNTYKIPRYYSDKENIVLNPYLPETEIEVGNIFLTKDINKAKKAIDYNGREKKRLGYSLKISRSTEDGFETSYLPNKKENAYWKVCLPYKEESEEGKGIYVIEIKDKIGKPLDDAKWEIKIPLSADEVTVNNNIFGLLLAKATKYLNVSRYVFQKDTDWHTGIKISNRSPQTDCNEYKLSISLDGVPCENLFTASAINDITPMPVSDQKYYNNIFELVNGFIGKFKPYQTGSSRLYNYISGETILKIDNNNTDNYIYYDLSFDVANNRDNPIYDKSGRILITNDGKKDPNRFIKLFKIVIVPKKDIPESKPRIESIVAYTKTLDRRIISSKRTEIDSLYSKARTDLVGSTKITDSEEVSYRSFEMLSNETEDNKLRQTRLYSPILRLTTKNGLTDSEPVLANEEDSPTNFTDSYNILDYTKSPDDPDYSKTKYHLDDDLGLILNNEKGLKLYSGNEKPIEIVASTGKINILNSNGKYIGIKNLTDDVDDRVDILGITNVRSKNDNQFIVNRLSSKEDPNYETASADILFQKNGSDLGNVEFFETTLEDGTTEKKYNLNIDKKNVVSSTKDKTNFTSDITLEKTLSVDTTGSNDTELALKVLGKSDIDGNTIIHSGEDDKLAQISLNKGTEDSLSSISIAAKNIESTADSITNNANNVTNEIAESITTNAKNININGITTVVGDTSISSGTSLVSVKKSEETGDSIDISSNKVNIEGITKINSESGSISLSGKNVDLSGTTTITGITTIEGSKVKSGTDSSFIDIVSKITDKDSNKISIISDEINIKGNTNFSGNLDLSGGITIPGVSRLRKIVLTDHYNKDQAEIKYDNDKILFRFLDPTESIIDDISNQTFKDTDGSLYLFNEGATELTMKYSGGREALFNVKINESTQQVIIQSDNYPVTDVLTYNYYGDANPNLSLTLVNPDPSPMVPKTISLTKYVPEPEPTETLETVLKGKKFEDFDNSKITYEFDEGMTTCTKTDSSSETSSTKTYTIENFETTKLENKLVLKDSSLPPESSSLTYSGIISAEEPKATLTLENPVEPLPEGVVLTIKLRTFVDPTPTV